MTTQTEIPAGEPTIVMTRVYEAPRDLVWRALTDPNHVANWWGGTGAVNRIAEMDVRPGGRWTHHMRLADGAAVDMNFVYVEVVPPERLIWQHTDYATRKDGPPPIRITVTLDALGTRRTRWTMVALFRTLAERDASVSFGFTRPIAASNEMLAGYLKTLEDKS